MKEKSSDDKMNDFRDFHNRNFKNQSYPSKKDIERRTKFKLYPEAQTGCLFLLSFVLFFFLPVEYSIAIAAILFVILLFFTTKNKAIRKKRDEWDEKNQY